MGLLDKVPILCENIVVRGVVMVHSKELKNKLIQSGDFQKFSYRKYLIGMYSKDFDECSNYNNYSDFLSFEEFKACFQIAHYKSAKKNKINEMINFYNASSNNWQITQSYSIWFATFTFNDATLTLSSKYRRRLLIESLNNSFTDFYCNIDFSPINNREHYHGIIFVEDNELKNFKLKYNNSFQIYSDSITGFNYDLGFYNFQRLNSFNQDLTILYTTKLSNHSYKAGTELNSVFTKRNSPYKFFSKTKKIFKKHDKKS